MSMPSTPVAPVEYPDSDGQPVAENTLQFRWIMTIQGGLDDLFSKDPNVFVAGDLLWYPVEGDNRTRQAPDALVAFGPGKGDRGSYRQWEEGGVAPQVVFEVLSPGNRTGEMASKFEFYQRFGVEEYYVYDPDDGTLEGWRRQDDQLQPIAEMRGWVSPLMHVRFDLVDGELRLTGPDGKPFATYLELAEQRRQAEKEARAQARRVKRAQREIEQQKQLLEQQRLQTEKEKQRAQKEKQRAQKEKQRAEQNALEKRQADERVEQLKAQLRALGIDPGE